jgi:hypothetical protein
MSYLHRNQTLGTDPYVFNAARPGTASLVTPINTLIQVPNRAGYLHRLSIPRTVPVGTNHRMPTPFPTCSEGM